MKIELERSDEKEDCRRNQNAVPLLPHATAQRSHLRRLWRLRGCTLSLPIPIPPSRWVRRCESSRSAFSARPYTTLSGHRTAFSKHHTCLCSRRARSSRRQGQASDRHRHGKATVMSHLHAARNCPAAPQHVPRAHALSTAIHSSESPTESGQRIHESDVGDSGLTRNACSYVSGGSSRNSACTR